MKIGSLFVATKPSFSTDKNQHWFSILRYVIPVCACLWVYSNTFQSAFHLDDFPSIVNNARIRDLSNLKAIWDFWPTRFLTYLSLAINYRLGQLHVVGYHAFNLLVHLGCVWGVAAVTKLLYETPLYSKEDRKGLGPWIWFFSAMVFAVHPLQTQAVTYVVQRATSLAAFFYLASVFFYIKSRIYFCNSKYPKGVFEYGVSMLLAVGAMFSKEMAISLPLVIGLIEFSFFRQANAGRWKILLPFFLLILLIPLTMAGTQSVDFSGMKRVSGISPEISPGHYFFTQLRVLKTYLGLLFFPIRQNVDYDYAVSRSFFEPAVLVSFLLMATIIASGVWLWHRHRVLSFAIFWFFLTMLPESSVIPIRDVIFEHRLYLPLFGFALFLTEIVFGAVGRKNVRVAIVLLVIATNFFGVLAHRRNEIWKTEISFWSDVIQKSPAKSRPYNERGLAYKNRAEVDLALRDYDTAIRLDPNNPIFYSNRAVAFSIQGEYSRAIDEFKKALALFEKGSSITFDFDFPQKIKGLLAATYFDQAVAYFNRGDYPAASTTAEEMEKMGFQVDAKFGEALRKAQGNHI